MKLVTWTIAGARWPDSKLKGVYHTTEPKPAKVHAVLEGSTTAMCGVHIPDPKLSWREPKPRVVKTWLGKRRCAKCYSMVEEQKISEKIKPPRTSQSNRGGHLKTGGNS